MHVHNVPKHLARALVAPRFAAGVLVTLALLSAACSTDSASRINAPSLSASMERGSGSNSGSSATASNFTVLAEQAVSCTGGSITGNVGTNQAPPTGKFNPTESCVFGTIHLGDPAAKAAFRSFLGSYAALAPKPRDVCTTLPGSTSSNTIPTSETLLPGVYCTNAALAATDVTLTLDAQGDPNAVWIFKIGTLGTGALTGTNFSVVMKNLGDPCNVTWWVAQAATMSTSTFLGNILAGAAISMTGGTLNGNAWAGASGVGDVTFTGGTVVTGCASINLGGNNGDNGDGNDDGDHGHGDKDHGDKGHGDKGHGDKGHEK
jgi:hypothetical protein